jgi:hypothetical protein
MTDAEFVRKFGIFSMTCQEKEVDFYYGFRTDTHITIEMSNFGVDLIKNMCYHEDQVYDILRKEHHEKDMREKYPAIQSAWDNYQLLLKIAND